MKELEEKIMAEVLHIIHDHEYSLVKVRKVIEGCLNDAYSNGHTDGYNQCKEELNS
jgi:hypothetical protein